MKKNQSARRWAMFVVSLALLCVAAVSGEEMIRALWFGPVEGRTGEALVDAAVLASTTALWIVLRSRALSARRMALLDVYAEREIARARGGPAADGP
jgi:hypothetical protein